MEFHFNNVEHINSQGQEPFVNDNYEDNGNDGMMLLMMKVLNTNNYNEDHVNEDNDCE